jgi:hypothetical protein
MAFAAFDSFQQYCDFTRASVHDAILYSTSRLLASLKLDPGPHALETFTADAVKARVWVFENGRGFSLRVLSGGKATAQGWFSALELSANLVDYAAKSPVTFYDPFTGGKTGAGRLHEKGRPVFPDALFFETHSTL